MGKMRDWPLLKQKLPLLLLLRLKGRRQLVLKQPVLKQPVLKQLVLKQPVLKQPVLKLKGLKTRGTRDLKLKDLRQKQQQLQRTRRATLSLRLLHRSSRSSLRRSALPCLAQGSQVEVDLWQG